MVVNSFVFLFFFAIVLIPYFTILRKWGKGQNAWLLAASYFFYGWADWKMIPVLLVATIVFYFLGNAVKKHIKEGNKKSLSFTTIGIVLGVGLLFYFKYLGFFVAEATKVLTSMGLRAEPMTLKIIMPIGISFFTFKLISYVVEIYRENIEPEKDFVSFATYIAFFPTIMSGPIDKPNSFIPQLKKARNFQVNNLSEGLKRILWGMFMKVSIADHIAIWTAAIFGNYQHHNATSIIVATFLYTIQLYADFAGYSEMAIGVAKIMGIKVTENFNRPFFSQNLADFWRRWHISLMVWLRENIYFPLGGSRCSNAKYIRNVFAVWIVSGLWHGANWTFVVWGLFHGVFMVITWLVKPHRQRLEEKYPIKDNEFYKWTRRCVTFILVVLGFMLFPIAAIGDVQGIYHQVTLGFGPIFESGFASIKHFALPALAVVLFREWVAEYGKNIHFYHSKYTIVKILSIALTIAFIMYAGELEGTSFIYFQF